MIEPLTPEWFEKRRTIITSTNVGSIMYAVEHDLWEGPPPRNSDFTAYQLKHQLIEEPESNPFMQAGRDYEFALIEKYRKKWQMTADECGLIVHPEEGWAGGTPDALLVTPAGVRVAVEAKWVHHYKASEWLDGGFPMAFYYQAMWHAFVSGSQWFALIAEIGGFDYREYLFRVNQDDLDRVVGICKGWWERHVRDEKPPPYVPTRLHAKSIRIAANDDEEPVEPSPELDAVIESYLELHGHVEAAKEQMEILQGDIKYQMGPSTTLVNDLVKIIFRENKRGQRTFRHYLRNHKRRKNEQSD